MDTSCGDRKVGTATGYLHVNPWYRNVKIFLVETDVPSGDFGDFGFQFLPDNRIFLI